MGNVVTGQWTGTNPLLITGASKPANVIGLGYFTYPDGKVTSLAQHGASFEPDGSWGGRGKYYVNTPPSAPFGPTPIIFSNPLDVGGNGGGLHDGNTLSGQYQIIAQLTITNGDPPGQRGTYLLNGSAPSPIAPAPMTYFSAWYCYTMPPNNYQQGNSVVPCVLTGSKLPSINPSYQLGGTSPATGTNGSVTWAWPQFDGANDGTTPSDGKMSLSLYSSPGAGGPITNLLFTSAGTGTMTPVPAFGSFTRFQFATKEGKYNFFQGTGSIVADTTLRVQINRAYWQSTGTFMPMDMSVNGATLPDTPFPYDWNPYYIGNVRQSGIDGGGPPVEVGLMCNIAGWDFYKRDCTDREGEPCLWPVGRHDGGRLQG